MSNVGANSCNSFQQILIQGYSPPVHSKIRIHPKTSQTTQNPIQTNQKHP